MVATHESIMKGNVLLSALKANISPDSATAKEDSSLCPKAPTMTRPWNDTNFDTAAEGSTLANTRNYIMEKTV